MPCPSRLLRRPSDLAIEREPPAGLELAERMMYRDLVGYMPKPI